ncbi:exodeoxyribonuclease VII small subunit [Georgenia sunbinii]|uniref:exodeoxyribonuclease VII small subunit n=1 Tax=Georgenia sunbinii TaxID=3117728 RepID=UPI002F266251
MTTDVNTLSYEQARDALVEVVRTLETGSATLEESMALWERGEALAARCQSWLDGARERLEKAHEATAGPATDRGTEVEGDA